MAVTAFSRSESQSGDIKAIQRVESDSDILADDAGHAVLNTDICSVTQDKSC